MAEVTTPAAAGTDMPITKVWFSFDGRIGRSTYWMKYFLPVMGITIGLTILDMILGTTFVVAEPSEFNGYTAQTQGIISGIWMLATIWIGLASGVKRCHDRNRSGWFLLIGFIPIIGAIWLLVELGFLRGTVGENRFGGDPVVG